MPVSPTNYYLNPNSGGTNPGSNSNGGTSPSDAWLTWQHAWDNMGAGLARLNVANTAAANLGGSPITHGSYSVGGTKTGALWVVPYAHTGGTMFKVTNGGLTIPAWEVNGGGAASFLSPTSQPAFVKFYGGSVHNFSTYALLLKAGYSFKDMEFYDCASASYYALYGASLSVHVEGCVFHSMPGGGLQAGYGLVKNNFFYDITGQYGISVTSPGVQVIGNVFKNVGSSTRSAVYTNNQDNVSVMGNVFYMDDGEQRIAVEVGSTNSEVAAVEGNVFAGYNHASGKAVSVNAGSYVDRLGNNGFWDCTTKYDFSTNEPCVDLRGNDVEVVSSPFVDEDNDDFSISPASPLFKTWLNAQHGGHPMSPGAAQTVNAEGGAGSADAQGPVVINDGVQVG